MTWFRREKEVIWLNKPDYGYDEGKILEAMIGHLEAAGILTQGNARGCVTAQ